MGPLTNRHVYTVIANPIVGPLNNRNVYNCYYLYSIPANILVFIIFINGNMFNTGLFRLVDLSLIFP